MSKPGTEERPLRVAIVGGGPSGFYAAEALLKAETPVKVDMYDRLPSPYGLVRYGVAPDHPKIKNVTRVYEKIANMPGFELLANVQVGKDITVEQLQTHYEAVIFACGAETDRVLGIPGEDLSGSHTATAFVAWYNGHPDYRHHEFDLSGEVAVVIGQGNVAMDVSRILSKTVDELKETDIAEHALEALSKSKIKKVYMIGRRGPVQAAFTEPEIKEMGKLEACDAVVDAKYLELNPESQTELDDEGNRHSQRNFAVIKEYATRELKGHDRQLIIRFFQSPVALEGEGKLERVVLETNGLSGEPFKQKARGTGEKETLDASILFRSVGYRGLPLPGVPFHEAWGIFPNEEGRVLDGDKVVPGFYTVGWIKRGPSGVIGTNKPDSQATVKSLLSDLDSLSACDQPDTEAVKVYLQQKGIRIVSFDDWKRIDQAEIERGQAKGKTREKFTSADEMLACL